MTVPYALIADLGATHARIAMVTNKGASYSNIEVVLSTTYASPIEVIEAYCLRHNIKAIETLALAIAAPITEDLIRFTNIAWTFSVTALKTRLKLNHLYLLNDVEALAYALPALDNNECVNIGTVSASKGPKLVLAPGTGMGTALLINVPTATGHRWQALASEGGHSLFSPQDTEELMLLTLAQQELKAPVIIEDLLSGKHGIQRLIRLMEHIHQQSLGQTTNETFLEQALKGHPFATQILMRYCAMLGGVAANFALITGATGGVYIGGGIIPRFLPFFTHSVFRATFEQRTTTYNYLKKIPTYVITEPYPALKGLLFLLHYHHPHK